MIKKVILFFLLVQSVVAEEGYFNEAEKQWIKDHRIINVAVNDYVPFAFFDESGAISGISSDYLNKVSKETGLEFRIKTAKSWLDIVTMLQNKETDLIPYIHTSLVYARG